MLKRTITITVEEVEESRKTLLFRNAYETLYTVAVALFGVAGLTVTDCEFEVVTERKEV